MEAETTPGLRPYAVLAVMPLLFASNLVIGRAAIDDVGPWTLAFWRWLLAFLILLPAAWPGFVRHRTLILGEWRIVAVLGVLGMWFCGGVVYLSLRHTTATNATLIYTSSPVVVLLLEMIFRGKRSSPRQIAGIALAFTGVLAILLRGDPARLMALEFNVGDIGMASAAIAWATYSVLYSRAGLGALPNSTLFAVIALAGCVVLVPFMAWESASRDVLPTGRDAWASILGVAVVASVLAFSAYQYGVRTVGPGTTSIFMYLLPAYGVGLAVLFLGETLAAYHAAGFVCVTCGVILATAPRRR